MPTDYSPSESGAPWQSDRLGYESVGKAFTNLVQSITDTKVISIEAGYGRGKTFFRENWAAQLRQVDEVAIEIDAHLSDHSGDPVLTFIGAMVEALPETRKEARKDLYELAKKLAGAFGRTVGGVLAKQGAGAMGEYVSAEILGQVELADEVEDQIKSFGEGMSKAAGSMVAAQIMAERVRTTGLPEQMRALRDVLTDGKPNQRVIVLVDELDRCHPDYAIAFLEAMKLVFAQDGFVFCLFVNDEYLEGLAAHRFGQMTAGERYLDKFIDIRLKLPDTKQVIVGATEALFNTLPEGTPFGEGDEFTISRAARLAGNLAPLSGLSMRQIERVKLRVELAIRLYRDKPLDYALLVWLGFREIMPIEMVSTLKQQQLSKFLLRSNLTPEIAEKIETGVWKNLGFGKNKEASEFLQANCSELVGLPAGRYVPSNGGAYHDWAHVCQYLAKDYIPEHEKVLGALLELGAIGEVGTDGP